jgi:hypothetical protein
MKLRKKMFPDYFAKRKVAYWQQVMCVI